jgi:cytochrome oxidase assembly protein ShyY1
MAMIRRRARPALRVAPTTAAVAVLALTLAAGAWQAGKARDKSALEARQAAVRDAAEMAVPAGPIEPAVVDGARMVARGEFLSPRTVYWDNRFAGKVAGIAVVTPLKLAGTARVLLVDRGIYVPGADRARLPEFAAPAGVVEVRGRAYLAPARTLELADSADGARLWQNLTPAKFTARTGLEAHGFLLREAGPAPAGLLRAPDQPAPVRASGMTADKHRGYAFQWFSLAALTLGLFAFFTFFEHVKPDAA